MESASQSRQADKAKPLVSIKDIAKEAGVSICTVSLVMNNKDRNRVSKAVAQRVRGTAQSMGYKPNSVARTLRTSRSYVLGFITDEIATTPHAGRVLVGAQEAARKLGYILLTVNTGNDRELGNQEIAVLRRFPVCHDVPPCCGDPRRTRRQPHGRRRQRRRESQDSLDLPRRRNGRVRCHQSADSGRLQTHHLLRFLNHHYRPGGAVRRVSPSARGRGHPLRRAVGRQRGRGHKRRFGSRSRVRRDQAGRHLLLQRCARDLHLRGGQRAVGRHRHRRFRDQHRQPAAHYGRAQTRVDHLGASSLRNGLRSGASAGRHDRR